MSNPHGRVVPSLLAVVLGVAAPLSAADPEPRPPAAVEVVGPQVILDSQKPPEFPPAARAGRFNGSVMLEATVLKNGKVGQVKVLECTRPKVGFEEASIAAVRQWRFEPGMRNGEPVEFSLKFRLNFSGSGAVPRVSAGSFVSATKDGPERSPMSAIESDSSAPKANPPR